MFKKRLAGNKRSFKASELDAKEEDDKALDEAEIVVIKAPVTSFKKRKVIDHLNSVSSKAQDVTSKDFMKKEVQDLTNNYKSSAVNKELMKEREVLRDEYLQIDSEKDGLYYAQQNMKIT